MKYVNISFNDLLLINFYCTCNQINAALVSRRERMNEPWWTFTRPAPSQSIYSSKAWELMKSASQTQTATQTSDRTSQEHLLTSVTLFADGGRCFTRVLLDSSSSSAQDFDLAGLTGRFLSFLSPNHPLPLKQHDKTLSNSTETHAFISLVSDTSCCTKKIKKNKRFFWMWFSLTPPDFLLVTCS